MTAFRRLMVLASLALVFGLPSLRAQAPAPAVVVPPAADTDDDADQTPSAGAGTGNLFPGSGPAAGQPPLGNRPRASRLLGNKNKRNARTTDLISSEADADPLEVRIAYRQAKTAAMEQDPAMSNLLLRAAAASTDKVKRVYLRQYYDRLFAAVKKINSSPELAAHVALLKIIARQRYDPQRRQIAGEEDLINGRRTRR